MMDTLILNSDNDVTIEAVNTRTNEPLSEGTCVAWVTTTDGIEVIPEFNCTEDIEIPGTYRGIILYSSTTGLIANTQYKLYSLVTSDAGRRQKSTYIVARQDDE